MIDCVVDSRIDFSEKKRHKSCIDNDDGEVRIPPPPFCFPLFSGEKRGFSANSDGSTSFTSVLHSRLMSSLCPLESAGICCSPQDLAGDLAVIFGGLWPIISCPAVPVNLGPLLLLPAWQG